MIHILIDSTVLRQDPRRQKGAFRLVSRLAKESKITLHLSDITRREYLSQQNKIVSDQFCKIASGLRGLLRQPINRVLESNAKTALDAVLSMQPSVDTDFDCWLNEVNAVIHPIEDSHGRRVLDAYFGGIAPFRSEKSREDFPDAFIWQSIVDLMDVIGELHVVTSDKKFAEACDRRDTIVLHETLTNFVLSTPIAELLPHTPNVSAFLCVIADQKDLVAKLIEVPLIDKLCEGHLFSSCYAENEISVTGAGPPMNFEIDIDNADDLGEGVMLVPFNADVECMLQYYMQKSDYYSLDEEVFARLSASVQNDHVMQIEEDRLIDVRGVMSVEIDVEMLESHNGTEEDVSSLLAQMSVAVEDIEELDQYNTLEW